MAASSSTARQLVASAPEHLRRRLSSARELDRQRKEAFHPRPTGVGSIDRLLGGGIARGRLIEVVGRAGSGRFSLALTALAAITSSGESAALIDLGDALDPQNAAACGIDLERLLWVRPPHLRTALAAAESVVGAGFPLVVVELGVPPVPGGRGAEAAWIRLARTAAERGLLVLVTAPYRVSGSAAATVLRAGNGRALWSGQGASPRLLEGLLGRLDLAKTRSGHRAAASAAFSLSSRVGIPEPPLSSRPQGEPSLSSRPQRPEGAEWRDLPTRSTPPRLAPPARGRSGQARSARSR
jgi:hypothetical protein